MEYPKRKSTRIPNYDYSTQNYYFVTICTHEKRCIFGAPEKPNYFGKIAGDYLSRIPEIYPDVQIEKYVVMPNHVHGILILGVGAGEKNLPRLTEVIGKYKAAVTKKIHESQPLLSVWQRSFHDHIIRNQPEFEKIWNYIEGNPSKWEEDCFF